MIGLTKTCEVYEVVVVPFPFTDTAEKKVRPALVLSPAKFSAKTGSIVMAKITSLKPLQKYWPLDIQIEDLKSSGLPVASLIRFSLFTLDSRLVLRKAGVLGKNDQEQIRACLKNLFPF